MNNGLRRILRYAYLSLSSFAAPRRHRKVSHSSEPPSRDPSLHRPALSHSSEAKNLAGRFHSRMTTRGGLLEDDNAGHNPHQAVGEGETFFKKVSPSHCIIKHIIFSSIPSFPWRRASRRRRGARARRGGLL